MCYEEKPPTEDQHWMALALEQARIAETKGEVPVGAVCIKDGQLIASAYNQSITQHDPSAHAEILVMREAGKRLENYRLPGVTLYVTLEPCAMCAYAMVHARIQRLVFATPDPRTGAAGSVLDLVKNASFNHRLEVKSGVFQAEASKLLKAFFRQKRLAQSRKKTSG